MQNFSQRGKQVIATEIAGLQALQTSLASDFDRACELLLNCRGKVVVSGMGKSGHIGNKIAATFASTGTPAFFMHPGEASHGDLGMLSAGDVLLAISNSGESDELNNILPVVKRLGIPYIAMTKNPTSSLAEHADVVLTLTVPEEACSLGLAPTTSTTVTLVLGDALAVALLDAKGFTSNDFALSHPAGALGRKLLLTCGDIMRIGSDVPRVSAQAMLPEALLEISQKGLGITAVVDDSDALLGIFTDGDLRRVLDKKQHLHDLPITDVMTVGGIHVTPDTLAIEALNIMEEKRISAMLVCADKQIVGAFNMHMLLSAGVL